MKVVTIEELNKVPLPNYEGDSYAVVSHTKAIKTIKDCLHTVDLSISKDKYYLSKDGQLASGDIYLNHDIDPESNCVISFENSYNKKRSFRLYSCLKMVDSGNIFILSTDKNFYKRVHKGEANNAITESICESVKHLKNNYNVLLSQKNVFKSTILDKLDIVYLLGKLYLEDDLLTLEQLSFVKKELVKSSYSYNCDKSSLFHIYMLCCLAFQKRNSIISKFWDCHYKLHNFLIKHYNINYSGKQLELNFEENGV